MCVKFEFYYHNYHTRSNKRLCAKVILSEGNIIFTQQKLSYIHQVMVCLSTVFYISQGIFQSQSCKEL